MPESEFRRFLNNIPPRDRPLLLALASAAGVLVLWLMCYYWIVVPVRAAALAQQARANLHAIQLAVERFAVDTEGEYPHCAADTVDKGYLTSLPLNPYTGQPMRELRAGDPPSRGDFYYLAFTPQWQGQGTPQFMPQSIDSYLLVLCLNPYDPLPLEVPSGYTLAAP